MFAFVVLAAAGGLLAGVLVGAYGAALKCRRENEAALRRRSALIQATSHELRTPLNNVLGLINGLKEDKALSAALGASQLQKLSESAGALYTMVRDSVDIFQLAEKKLQTEPQIVNLSEIVEKKLKLFQKAVSRRGYPVKFGSMIAEDVWVEADPDRIRQCLMVILKQALFQTQHGKITVKLVAQKNRAANATLVRIEIADDSDGIEQSVADTFFIPEAYQENPYLHGRPGAMLSINLAKGIAELLGGRLSVKSAPAAGVTFTLDLALRTAARKSAANVAEKSENDIISDDTSPVSGARVLVVDDDETNLLIMESYLQANGAAEIMLAPNGLTAVELAKQHPFDLVLMDLQMPDIDGLEATRRIRNGNGYCAKSPIIAVSASSRIVNLQICEDAGMNGFVEKPVDFRILLSAIRQAGPLRKSADKQEAA